MDTMRKYGIPLTRENYMEMNDPDNMIHDSESESMMPKALQKINSAGFARGGKVHVSKNMDVAKLEIIRKAK